MRIAVCFFGITRSLRHTFPSIEANVLTPARDLGEVRIYSHFFQQREIAIQVSPAYTEHGTLDVSEHELLASDRILFEEPDQGAVLACLDRIKRYGDHWNSDFVLLRNLIHQLHSLRDVTQAALADGADVVAFCRPDLRYHDSLGPALRKALRARNDLAILPYWQGWDGGLNDRFAICHGRKAIAAYGSRLDVAEAFCTELGRPLHAESLVRFALRRAEIPLRMTGVRATRIRVGGHAFSEDFRHPILRRVQNKLDRILGRKPDLAPPHQRKSP